MNYTITISVEDKQATLLATLTGPSSGNSPNAIMMPIASTDIFTMASAIDQAITGLAALKQKAKASKPAAKPTVGIKVAPAAGTPAGADPDDYETTGAEMGDGDDDPDGDVAPDADETEQVAEAPDADDPDQGTDDQDANDNWMTVAQAATQTTLF